MGSRLIVLVASFGLLVAAANVGGVWRGQMDLTGKGKRDVTLTLKQDGTKLTGSIGPSPGTTRVHAGPAEIQDAKLDGDELSFTISTGFADMPKWEFHGKADGDVLNFQIRGKLVGATDTMKVGDAALVRGH
jgi:hypothetical protein